jgi:hypothetical protein
MSRNHLFLLPVLVGIVFFLTGSMEQTAAPVLSIPGPMAEKCIEPWKGEVQPIPTNLHGLSVTSLLDQAMAQWNSEKVPSLEMSFRQQVAYDDIGFELSGRYLAAPPQRFRFEQQVKIGAELSKTLVICDGKKLIEIEQLPGKNKRTNALELPTVKESTEDPAAVVAARQALLQSKNFPGIASLLFTLRAGLRDPVWRLVRVKGQDMLEIKGKWETNNKGEPESEELRLRPELQECCIYLDAANLWPRCVEWWGNRRLLVQSVYDLIKHNEPVADDQLAREEF